MTNWCEQLLRRSLLVIAVGLVVGLSVTVAGALALPRLMGLRRVTWTTDTDRGSHYPSLNADGTIVAFRSDSDFLGEGRPNDLTEVWLYDTKTLTYTRITSATNGFPEGWYVSLSGDGTVVAFESDSNQLNEGRPADVFEIWLYDTKTLTYTRVTSASDSSRESWYPSLSHDGNVVAFYSDSDFLSEGRPQETYEVWLYHTPLLTYTRITSASDAARDSYYPRISGDGTVVAFRSDSDFLNEGRPQDVNEIWLYDTKTLTFTRVTSASSVFRDSYRPSPNGDGTVVAFSSDSDFLEEGRPDDLMEIWLYDTKTLTFTRVTSASAAGRDSQYPSLSADGNVVAFTSDSDLLNEGRQAIVHEVWLYDTRTLTYTRVTSASAADRTSRSPSLSGEGTVVAFKSDSDLLGEGIADGQWEIWLWGKEFAYDIYLPLVLGLHQ